MLISLQLPPLPYFQVMLKLEVADSDGFIQPILLIVSEILPDAC